MSARTARVTTSPALALRGRADDRWLMAAPTGCAGGGGGRRAPRGGPSGPSPAPVGRRLPRPRRRAPPPVPQGNPGPGEAAVGGVVVRGAEGDRGERDNLAAVGYAAAQVRYREPGVDCVLALLLQHLGSLARPGYSARFTIRRSSPGCSFRARRPGPAVE